MRHDVIVVGAGPAGLYAAQLLARQGLTVRVLEEHEQVGEPVHCTGILGTEAFKLPGVPRDVVVGRPVSGRFHSPGGYCLGYTGPTGEVCVIDRGAFDRGLAAAAGAAGAKITTGARAVGFGAGRSGVTIHARVRDRLQSIAGQVCLLACGARYDFQRALGWGGPSAFLGSAQVEVGACAAGDGLDLFFRRETAPTGFGWMVPITRNGEPRAKVGVMVPKGARRILKRMLEELRASGRVLDPTGPVVGRLLPLGPLPRTYDHRVLAIGDAAGLVKPTTGGGIYYSLLSARWAAETVTAAFDWGDFSATFLGGYEETWRAHLGRELAVGVWLRRLAAWFTPGDLDGLAELAMTDGLMPVVSATARFNWHHDLIIQALRHPGVFQIVFRRLLKVAVGGGDA